MKTLVCAALSLMLGSSFAMAATQAPQVELDLQAMALVQMSQPQVLQSLDLSGSFGKLGDFLKQIDSTVKELRESILNNYDTNHNGFIDPGTEFDNFKENVNAIILVLTDSNQNGQIDLEDIKVLNDFIVDQIKGNLETQFCNEVKRQAEFAGFFLDFNPILKKLNEDCLAK